MKGTIERCMRASVAVACAAVLALPAQAGTNTGTLSPSMTITKTCLATAATVSFPEYLPNSSVALSVAGMGATIQCNNGDAWSITAGPGNNAAHKAGTCGSAACQRAMTDGSSHYIGYDLFVGACCSGTTVWNTTNKISGTGDGSVQAVTFWGMVAASQNVAAGTYTDTVVATYTF